MGNHHFNGKTHYKWPFSIAFSMFSRPGNGDEIHQTMARISPRDATQEGLRDSALLTSSSPKFKASSARCPVPSRDPWVRWWSEAQGTLIQNSIGRSIQNIYRPSGNQTWRAVVNPSCQVLCFPLKYIKATFLHDFHSYGPSYTSYKY